MRGLEEPEDYRSCPEMEQQHVQYGVLLHGVHDALHGLLHLSPERTQLRSIGFLQQFGHQVSHHPDLLFFELCHQHLHLIELVELQQLDLLLHLLLPQHKP